MIELSKDRVDHLLDTFKNKKVLILGDLMLDRYLTGQVSRLSPEAPVPVVEIEEEYARLGGAANVGNNIKSLGGVPYLVGVVGRDAFGGELRKIVADSGFPAVGILEDPSRPTTVKTRVIASNQHVVRTDRESKNPLNSEMVNRVKDIIATIIQETDAVIIEDYNKGLITEEIIRFTIKEATHLKKIITVDPKFDHFFAYQNVTVFKPNRREAEEVLGMKLNSQEQVIKAAHRLFDLLNCRCLMITLGEQGMAIFNHDREVQFIPTRARKVHDVSGAGDTVISTVTLSLSSRATFEEAATLANFAAGSVCAEVGIVPITPEALRKAMNIK